MSTYDIDQLYVARLFIPIYAFDQQNLVRDATVEVGRVR